MFGDMTDSDVNNFIRDNFEEDEWAYVTWYPGCPRVLRYREPGDRFSRGDGRDVSAFAIPHTNRGMFSTLLEQSNSEALMRDYPEWLVEQDCQLWFIADDRHASPEDYDITAQEILEIITGICADMVDMLFYDEEDYRRRLDALFVEEWESLGASESDIPWDDMDSEWGAENFGEYIYIPKKYFAEKFPHLANE